jgi:uncharacterized Fe-S cluster-containing radical SAM superfamily protein
MMRDPRTDPRPGDEMAGPIARVKVLSVTYDEGGLSSVELVGCGRQCEYELAYKFTFSAARWISFTEKAEVLTTALDAARKVQP